MKIKQLGLALECRKAPCFQQVRATRGDEVLPWTPVR